jgi:hypothetical protein
MIPGKLTVATLANRLAPGGPIEVDTDRMLCNDVIFADEYNPNRVRPWVIGNQFGPLCLVWAGHEQDALDAACDAGMLDGLALEPDNVAERSRDECEGDHPGTGECCPYPPSGVMLLGNASEPFDVDYAWLAEVALTPLQERYFAEARGAGVDVLGKL